MTGLVGIVAIDKDRGMGYLGRMPWGERPLDAEHFRQHTLGRPLIVGRKTYPQVQHLDRRHMIVLSAARELPYEWRAPHVTLARDPFEAMSLALPICSRMHTDTICVIGGLMTFEAMRPYITEFRVTQIRSTYPSDRQFPEFATPWTCASKTTKNGLTFQHWRKPA